MKNIVKKIYQHKRNLLTVTLGQIIAALGTLFGVRLLTEYISPTVYGEYKLLLAAISLPMSVFVRPLIQFLMREYHDADRDGVPQGFIIYARNFFRNYIFFIAGLVIMVAILLFESIKFSIPLLILFLAFFMLSSSVELERAFMTTRNQQIQASLVSIARNWLVPVGIFIAVILTEKTVLVMFFATVVVFVGIFFFWQYLPHSVQFSRYRNTKKLDKYKITRNAINFGIPLAAVGLLSWFVHESDRFFLSYFHSEEAVGIYSAAYGLVSAPFTLVVGAMAQFLYPIMFRVSAEGNQKNKNNVLKTMLIASSFICFVGVIFVGFFDDYIAWLALGEQYRYESEKLLFWIALGYGFLSVSMSFDLAAYGNKRTTDILIANTGAAIANVSLNVIFIPDHGAMGAVIATVISLFFYLIIISVLFLYKENILVLKNFFIN